MDPQPIHPELFPHIRIVMGMVIGLGITRLLMGVAGLIQHPNRNKPSTVHLLWVGSILVELVLFWWWEFALFQINSWSFGLFFFLIFYAVTLFLMAALLFPDNITEYAGYEDFFLKRRKWFFGLLAATFVFDSIDTLIKGAEHWERFGPDYFLQVPFGLVLCALGIWSANRRLHIAVPALHIGYQLYWIIKVFNTMT